MYMFECVYNYIVCYGRFLEFFFNFCIDGNGVEDVIEVIFVVNLKFLIFFEDIDIFFVEDRGFVSVI